jgi:hypothetical protein
MEAAVSVVQVHTSNWILTDVHRVHSPLLLVYYFIHCLHNMAYGQLNYEIYLSNSRLVYQIHIRFLQLFTP